MYHNYLVEHLELYHQFHAAQRPDPHTTVLPTRCAVSLIRTEAHFSHLQGETRWGTGIYRCSSPPLITPRTSPMGNISQEVLKAKRGG